MSLKTILAESFGFKYVMVWRLDLKEAMYDKKGGVYRTIGVSLLCICIDRASIAIVSKQYKESSSSHLYTHPNFRPPIKQLYQSVIHSFLVPTKRHASPLPLFIFLPTLTCSHSTLLCTQVGRPAVIDVNIYIFAVPPTNPLAAAVIN